MAKGSRQQKKKCVKPTAFPCKFTCLPRRQPSGKLTNCKNPLKGQAATAVQWVADQERRLKETNEKRSKRGLSLARLENNYIVAEKPVKSLDQAKSDVWREAESYAMQNSKYGKAYEKIKQALIETGDWNYPIYDEERSKDKGSPVYSYGSSLAKRVQENFKNGDRLLSTGDVLGKRFRGSGLTRSYAQQIEKLEDDYHPLLKKKLAELTQDERSGKKDRNEWTHDEIISDLMSKFKVKGIGGITLAIATRRDDKLYEQIALGYSNAQDVKKVYGYAKSKGMISIPDAEKKIDEAGQKRAEKEKWMSDNAKREEAFKNKPPTTIDDVLSKLNIDNGMIRTNLRRRLEERIKNNTIASNEIDLALNATQAPKSLRPEIEKGLQAMGVKITQPTLSIAQQKEQLTQQIREAKIAGDRALVDSLTKQRSALTEQQRETEKNAIANPKPTISTLTKFAPIGRENILDYAASTRRKIVDGGLRANDPVLGFLDVLTNVSYANQTGRLNPATQLALYKVKGKKAEQLITNLMQQGFTNFDDTTRYLNQNFDANQKTDRKVSGTAIADKQPSKTFKKGSYDVSVEERVFGSNKRKVDGDIRGDYGVHANPEAKSSSSLYNGEVVLTHIPSGLSIATLRDSVNYKNKAERVQAGKILANELIKLGVDFGDVSKLSPEQRKEINALKSAALQNISPDDARRWNEQQRESGSIDGRITQSFLDWGKSNNSKPSPSGNGDRVSGRGEGAINQSSFYPTTKGEEIESFDPSINLLVKRQFLDTVKDTDLKRMSKRKTFAGLPEAVVAAAGYSVAVNEPTFVATTRSGVYVLNQSEWIKSPELRNAKWIEVNGKNVYSVNPVVGKIPPKSESTTKAQTTKAIAKKESTPKTPSKRKTTKKLRTLDQISDFRKGIDKVETINGKTYVVSGDGLYKNIQIEPPQEKPMFETVDDTRNQPLTATQLRKENIEKFAERFVNAGKPIPSNIINSLKEFPDLVQKYLGRPDRN